MTAKETIIFNQEWVKRKEENRKHNLALRPEFRDWTKVVPFRVFMERQRKLKRKGLNK